MEQAAKVFVTSLDGSFRSFEAETMDVPPHLQAKVFGLGANYTKILVIGSFHPSQSSQPQALCAQARRNSMKEKGLENIELIYPEDPQFSFKIELMLKKIPQNKNTGG